MNIKKLYKSFDTVEERQGYAGMKFKFVKGADVITRLNQVFEGRWSNEIVSVERDGDNVLVHVRLTVYDVDDQSNRWAVLKDAFGSAVIERYTRGPKEGQIIDFGNAFKAATTDGIKKAASLMGVGLYLTDVDNPVLLENGNGEEEALPKPSEPSEPAVEETPVPEKPFKEPEPIVPPVPSTVELPKGSEEQPEDDEGCSSVQQTAIANLASMKGSTVEACIANAIKEDGQAIEDVKLKPIEKLTYDEAVKAIRYANNLPMPKKQ